MSTLPKIPLDSSSDLSFLRTQLHLSLSSILSRHLPNALPEDSLRTAIESHISAFLSSTMQETSQNVLINGLPPRPSDIAKGVQVEEGEVYELLDGKLQSDVVRRHAELEDLITRVTQMRREVPLRIMRALETSSAGTEKEGGEEVRRGEDVRHDGEEEEEEEEVGVREVEIPRSEEVVASYIRSVKLMKEMKGNVGTVTAKAQRAKDVMRYLHDQQHALAEVKRE